MRAEKGNNVVLITTARSNVWSTPTHQDRYCQIAFNLENLIDEDGKTEDKASKSNGLVCCISEWRHGR